jgi:hypothetical protein
VQSELGTKIFYRETKFETPPRKLVLGGNMGCTGDDFFAQNEVTMS